MGRRLGRTEVSKVVDQVRVDVEAGGGHVQDRSLEGMRQVLALMTSGKSVKASCETAGFAYTTYLDWRKRYPAFNKAATRVIGLNQAANHAAAMERQRQQRIDGGLIWDPDREVAERPGLVEFRRDFFGRPTPIHQQAAVKALEDLTNLYVFIFGPTGMGKDTLAGDYVAWRVAPDRTGLRVAWFMENEDFSKRRMRRLSAYLTDPSVYQVAPSKTPGGSKPTKSLIDEWGPFRWEKGMVTPDGKKVERPSWNALAMYFLSNVAPEADPNLWATGVRGATFGSRIDEAVLSDLFTVENQKSPTERESQYEWVDGTLDTRLDEAGRLVQIGTMLPDDNNYERMLAEYVTDDAWVVSEEHIGPGVYTKYSNGVAVVIVKAIVTNPETGEEQSYWPERFPLDDQLIVDGERVPIEGMSRDRLAELLATPGVKRERGLRSKRQRSPRMFAAMFQQERLKETGGDFTDELLTLGDDPERTYGVVYPSETVVVGVDPAISGGAAWVAWAVNRQTGVCTVVDFWWGQRLGVTGIKQRLIIEPLSKYAPSWLAYESNMESAVLDDWLIKQALADFGTAVYTHRTGAERNDMNMGPGSMAAFIRAREIRWPTKTEADRKKTETLKAHIQAWQRLSLSQGRRKPGRHGQAPDDIFMAAHVGWLKGRTLAGGILHGVLPRLPVPASVMRKWRKRSQPSTVDKVSRGQSATAADLATLFVGNE